MLSLVVPVYRNEDSIPALVETMEHVNNRLDGDLEVVFVDDGSPDGSRRCLERLLPNAGFASQLVVLSRNFGSLSAVHAGLAAGRGDTFAVMSADLQEPPELILAFQEALASGRCDVIVGSRDGRADPLASRLAAAMFWWLYRALVRPDMPKGGVDVFGCTRRVRDEVLTLNEANSTLVGLILWLGFRRQEVTYSRRPRHSGKSAWSFKRKWKYLLDSSFAFSELPIRLLSLAGLSGMALALALAALVVAAKVAGQIPVPGYSATVLTVMFFGGLNSFGIGVLGEYLWRTFENTKGRPRYIVSTVRAFSRVDGGHIAPTRRE